MPYTLESMSRRIMDLMRIDPAATEISSVMMGASWIIGLVLGKWWFGYNLVDAYSYKLVLELLPQEAWVLLIAGVSAGQAVGLLAEDRLLRRLAAFFASVTWFTLATLILVHEPFHLMGWAYAVFGIANAWATEQTRRH